jgi:cytochrome c biogenesis factor
MEKMRIIVSILAVLLMLVGVVWVLQGIGVIGGSVMTGQSQWTIIGGVSFIVGVGLLVFANRKKSSPMNMQK